MNRRRIVSVLTLLGIPVAYGLVLRLVFGYDRMGDLFQVMSLSFLFCMPTIMGILTVYFSSPEKTKRLSYAVFVPILPILVLLVLTLILDVEGWGCWIMALPLFVLAGAIGGLIGRYLKFRKRNDKVYVSLALLLPVMIAPVERLTDPADAIYTAYTSIDIQAPAAAIWANVTNVRAIPESADKGWLTRGLRFPRPLEAVLDYEGVGGSREARFTGGLVFHETVTDYQPMRKMVFSIKAYPHEIPSTTMDEHIVIGGDYFDVLNGTYELEALGGGRHRLHLYSHFRMRSTFNWYAAPWGRWIMKDIQHNILQVEKQRSETAAATAGKL